MLPIIQDITALTQELIHGPVAAWQHYTKRIKIWSWLALFWPWLAPLLEALGVLSRREFIAAKNPDDELIILHRKTPWHGWNVFNISQQVNQNIASQTHGWTSKKGLTFNWKENIVAMNPQGDLIHFRGRATNWVANNISTITGQKITGPVTRWPYAGDDHFASVGIGDELLVFSGLGNNWSVENLSNNSGLNILGPLTSWVTPNGSSKVPHIAGRTPAGELIVFWLSVSGDWKHVNVSSIAGREIAGGLCSWQTRNGPYLVEHLGAKGTAGEVLVFWWSPQHDWQVVDVSRINNEKITGVPVVYQHRDIDGENAEVLAFRGEDEKLFIHWWKPSSDWLAIDLTAATQEPIYADPACWVSYDRQNKPMENVAAQAGDFRLLIFNFDQKPRHLVEHLVAPYEGLTRLRGVSRDMLVILWDWNDPRFSRPDKTDLDNALFGSTNSLKDYYRENSNGHFSIRRIDIRGWYDAQLPSGDYQYNDLQDSNNDGFVNQWHLRYKEAVQMTYDDGFPFSSYDTDQNGKLSFDELPMLLITPGDGNRGFVRNINEVEYPQTVRLSINGLEFDSIIEVYSSLTPTIGIYAHEFGHAYLKHGDMYWDNLPAGTYMKYAPGQISVMDSHGIGAHYDPFAKMKLGWVSPRIVLHSGHYRFVDIETGYKVWVLMDPNRGHDEYFLIENRWPANTYDQNLPDSGLAVWHIIEDHNVYNALPVPAGMDPTRWTDTQTGRQWSRLGVRLIRPVDYFSNQISLWDGADPATSYDLLSNDSDPAHSELRWADGTPSGFEIRSISSAGSMMSAYIEVPF